MKIKLLPCPFCGGQPKFHVGLNNFSDVEIQCEDCSCSGGCFDDDSAGASLASIAPNKEAAAKHWNKRTKVKGTL